MFIFNLFIKSKNFLVYIVVNKKKYISNYNKEYTYYSSYIKLSFFTINIIVIIPETKDH